MEGVPKSKNKNFFVWRRRLADRVEHSAPEEGVGSFLVPAGNGSNCIELKIVKRLYKDSLFDFVAAHGTWGMA